MYPLVSCLMPTYNRREFIPRALRNFASQTYPDLELIVVDDGSDLIADLIPRDDLRISYFWSDQKANHGEKMNIAAGFADGDYCCVWDDDDCYAPDRVSRQITPLVGTEKIVSGTSSLYYYKHGGQQAYIYDYPTQPAPWIGAIAFRRDYWEHNEFDDLRSGADFTWLKKIQYDQRVDLHDPSLLVCAIHDTNAAPKPIGTYIKPIEWFRLPEWFRNAAL